MTVESPPSCVCAERSVFVLSPIGSPDSSHDDCRLWIVASETKIFRHAPDAAIAFSGQPYRSPGTGARMSPYRH
ncbi:MAG: hypothetical protein D6741_09695 [Planctomycetota bacterium]|nr:MAG: hypothetical protein D6741_09695 [Planctomycetota bacterium]